MGKIKDKLIDKKDEVVEYKFDSTNHIHTFTSKPLLGTSTILSVLAKPLTWWASGLAVGKLGWINGNIKVNGKYTSVSKDKRIAHTKPYHEMIKRMEVEEYIKLLDEAYKAHSVKLSDSADAGTDMHAELERYVKAKMLGLDMTNIMLFASDKLKAFDVWVELNVDKFLWSEAHTFNEDLWIGGISDLGVKMKDGKVGIVDFKSSKEAYESQFIQCGGYDLQLSKNGGFDSEGRRLFKPIEKIDFYAIIPFGKEGTVDEIIEYRYNVEELKEVFKACLTIYKLMNK